MNRVPEAIVDTIDFHEETSSKEVVKGSLKDLIKNKAHLGNLLIAIVLWVVSLMSYYTVYFHIRYLGGDFFINVVVFGTCEVSAYALGGFITSLIGTKPSYLASQGLAIISTCLYLWLRSDHPYLTPVVLAAAGFGIVWACNINWNGNAQFFPVIYASSTNGICNFFGRISSAVAPQLSEISQPYPMIIIALSCLLGCFLSVFLKLS